MNFVNPEWFAVLPALALAGWYWKRLRMWQPLRILCLLLLVTILARPQMRLTKTGMDLYVLLDRSASTEDLVDNNLMEWRKLLEAGKRTKDDQLIFVDYAAEMLPQDPNHPQSFPGKRNLTRTNLAVQNTLAMRDPEKPARILLFSDGYSTEPLTGLQEKLVKENVPLDARILHEKKADDFRISALHMPVRVQVSEPFLIEVEVAGPKDAKVPVTIYRNEKKMKEAEIEVKKGRGVVRFTDRIPASGAHKYHAVISPANDGHLGNNRYENWIEASGGPSVLLITKYLDDPLASVLGKQGYVVESSLPQALNVGQLAGRRAVIFNNVPAYEVPAEFLASMDFYVTAQGGGVLMVGGKQSFGSGGYYGSSMDKLLPVSMELKTDQRKLSVAMAIVMDRSGSMSMTVAGGIRKMDLANEGAGKAIEMLGHHDSIAVYAVDSEAHEAVGMQQIGDANNKDTLIQMCRRIQSGGGGIFTYNGLKAGWKALQASSHGTKHLILFADAADAEQHEGCDGLVDEMVAAGATLSVIALGTKADSDAVFLEEIAKRGKGRIFFTDKAEEVPAIFTQETVAVARSAFVSEPVPVLPTGGWAEISAGSFSWLKQVDGYNLSYKRDWASQALISHDEYQAPLVAWGQRGAGRSLSISFPLGGEHSKGIRAWEKYGDFVQTAGRWLMGEDLPPGLGLRYNLAGTELSIDLLYEDEWEEKLSAKAPRIVLAEGLRGENQHELIWRRLSPGHYSVSVDLEEGQVVRGALQVDKFTLAFGPVVVGSSAEWAFDPARADELRSTVALSGGRILADLKEAWVSPPVKLAVDIRHWLLIAALVLILLEALIARMGWNLPNFSVARVMAAPALKDVSARAAAKPPKPAAQRPAPAATINVPFASPPPAVAQTAETQVDEADEKRRSRFARAKGNDT